MLWRRVQLSDCWHFRWCVPLLGLGALLHSGCLWISTVTLPLLLHLHKFISLYISEAQCYVSLFFYLDIGKLFFLKCHSIIYTFILLLFFFFFKNLHLLFIFNFSLLKEFISVLKETFNIQSLFILLNAIPNIASLLLYPFAYPSRLKKPCIIFAVFSEIFLVLQ